MSEVATTSAEFTPAAVTAPITNSDGKAVLEGGETPLTFDELEQITIEKKNSKAKPKEESIDLTSDENKGKKQEAKKEEVKEESPEDKDAKKQESDSKKAEKELRKTIKAKFKDADLELDEETLIPVTVNGKEELWTLKEIRNQQSGKVAYDKKFSELDKMRKEVLTKDQSLAKTNELIKSVFEEKDPTLKMIKMSQLVGVDPVQFRNQFLADNVKMLEKWYTMSDDERKADALEFEARVHKHRADTLENATKQQQSDKELHEKIANVRASHNLSEEDFFSTLDKLYAQADKGIIKPESITPENVAMAFKADQYFNATVKALEPIAQTLDSKTYEKMIQEISLGALNNGLKLEDINYIVDELYGKGKAEKKVAEKKREIEQFVSGSKETKLEKKFNQPLFFDEIL
jgi:hypothetical protein